MNDQIVTFAVRQVAVDGLQHPATLCDVHALVGLRVPVEVRILFVRFGVVHRYVGVEQQRRPIERRTPAWLHLGRPKVPVLQRRIVISLERQITQPLDRLDRRRRMGVIEQRRRSGEPLVPHQLFGIDAAVRLAKCHVALSRNLAEGVIDRHD